MSEALASHRGSAAPDRDNRNTAAMRTADVLSLAAAPTFALMSAFHSAPWLKLISGRRSSASSPTPQ